MKTPNRFWTSVNVVNLLSLLAGQCILFYELVKTDDSGPLGGLIIFFWAGGTGVAILIHVLLFLFSSRKLLFGIAFITSVLFWTIAWNSYNYLQRTKNTREKTSTSDKTLKMQERVKTQVEKTLRKKNIACTWVPDSLCFKVYRADSTCYYIAAGAGFYIYEKMVTPISIRDTTAWIKGLRPVLPLLNTEQLSQLDKSLKAGSFCLSRAYRGYSSAFPCWGTVVSQKYDTLTKELSTFIHFSDKGEL